VIEALDLTMKNIYYLEGGAGRVLCSIPAFEKLFLENQNFDILTSYRKEFFIGNPLLEKLSHSIDRPGLFNRIIRDNNLIKLEPYHIKEYYNQQCSLATAFNIEINNDPSVLPPPKIYFTPAESQKYKTYIEGLKKEHKKNKVLVFQPFGMEAKFFDDGIFDSSNRSFIMENIVDLIQMLRKDYLILWMGGLRLNISNQFDTILYFDNDINLRDWAGYIMNADHFLGMDSIGQHLAKAVGQTATVVIAGTYPINVTWPNTENFHVLDLGKDTRQYDPIRITYDDKVMENNNGLMRMSDKLLDQVVESVNHLGNM